MKSEYRAILAVALSAGFFVVWSTWINPPKKADLSAPAAVEQVATTPTTTETAPTTTTTAPSAATTPASVATAEDPQANLPVKTATLKNDVVEMTLSTDGGVLSSVRALGYTTSTEKDSPPIELITSAEGLPAPLSVAFEKSGIAVPSSPRFELLRATDDHVLMRWRSNDVEIEKKITLAKGSYVADVELAVKNLTDRAVSMSPLLRLSAENAPKKKSGFFAFLTGQQEDLRTPAYYLDGKVERPKELKQQETKTGKAYWAGIESRYFISAVIPRVLGEGLAVDLGGGVVSGAPQGTTGYWVGVMQPALSLPAKGSASTTFSVYIGPKEMERLKALNVNLEEAIDYGWFTIVAIPILYLLKFFYGLVHNYGVAIILLTIFVKLLLHPINVKSLKSMKAMQQLQPRLKELQLKYKDDRQKLQMETMQLFRAHKVNPMGGCLPMVAQLPIYVALYRVLWSSIELYHAPFFWFYRDLAAPDPYLITPILLGLFMLAQQVLTPTASADPAQKKMMMFMPIMFTGFMLFLPVGLVIYILINTAMSVIQQWMMNKGIGFRDLVTGRFREKLEASNRDLMRRNNASA